MKKFTILVTQTVEVELDETKFDDKFMLEFQESFYPFTTLSEHARHLAQLEARGLFRHYYLEGYGDTLSMKIRTKVVNTETEEE